jgi:MoaA/NifB/PqqE/SkfB family radical SAM enzyme
MNTNECNERCTKCSHWKYKDKAARIPSAKLIDCLTSIPTVIELCIVGGEPLLFKSEIYDILQGIEDTSIRTVIITNGVLLDKVFINTVSKYNIHIVVSIDTIDRDFWKFVRGTNSYDRVLNNFEYATRILTPAQISIQSVLSVETQPYIAKVSEFAKSKNIFHSIQDYIADGFEGSWTILKNKQVIIPDNAQQCFAANRNLSIVQNGDIYTCFQQTWIEDCQKPLGNINSQSMNDILSSEYSKSVLEKMLVCNHECKVLKCNTKG